VGLKTALIAFGLATSVPLIVAGSAILMALLERFPILVWAGGALLGWVAGDIMAKDEALLKVLPATTLEHLHVWAMAGALFVVAVGYLLVRSRRTAKG
jgi:predicted tellurium resistance membrane protein TerC